ncbi:hypothetical protein JX265_001410 [Neoarthrinium moseri]|uniref:Uncharacterized protein n=1 Tax=Neoarthrinium moseri TaxID=1658444 RepID=A0A9P9WV10_9PEZI|nr:uncharacterized protein JN550_009832 [Neoarthrinium moseri]KAI1842230.1 hypothetical protein JX266_011638 [Neoarthrinium moseri]KAI1863096.1 hypothetical protein JN550_009832 [Neoarthrinium moseri]KAI1879789.1 hypothetical protein JX265_001410 [Neoarthrinium moseri]
MSGNKTTLTGRDLELAGLVWQCFDTEPKINYAKLAELAGFKNSATASACWGPVKKKLMAAADNGEGPATTPKSAKRKATTKADDGTPIKKARTPKAKAKATVDTTPAEDEPVKDEEDVDAIDAEA